MISIKELDEMRNQSITNLVRNDLVDISTVPIDTSVDICERMENYIRKVKNPYCILCGDTPVQISFAPDGKDLEKMLEEYLIHQKNR